MNELIESILKITNESPFGWLDIDSVEAKKIEELIKEYKNKIDMKNKSTTLQGVITYFLASSVVALVIILTVILINI